MFCNAVCRIIDQHFHDKIIMKKNIMYHKYRCSCARVLVFACKSLQIDVRVCMCVDSGMEQLHFTHTYIQIHRYIHIHMCLYLHVSHSKLMCGYACVLTQIWNNCTSKVMDASGVLQPPWVLVYIRMCAYERADLCVLVTQTWNNCPATRHRYGWWLATTVRACLHMLLCVCVYAFMY
jgi:hypothetical protein